ncbi:MAG: ATP-binding protein [Oscillospiraceae bacterium]
MAKKQRFSLLRSMQVKYALTYIAVIAAVLVLLNTYPVLASQNLIFKSKQTSLLNQAAVVASALAGLENLTSEGVEQVMNQLDDAGLTRIMVTDAAGMILYDTVEGGGTLYQYALIREVSDALSGNTVCYSEYVNGQFQSRAAWPVIYRNMCIGSVFLYEEDTEQAALLQGMQSNLRSVSMVVVVLVLLLSIVFSKALTGRVGALLRAIRIVREGNYSHRVQLKGGDELAQLADEFNRLTDRLQTTEEVRRRFVSDASHELKTPLASIRLLTDSILQSEHMDPETAREFVTDIGEEADRLTRISEKLLTLTRLDAAPEVERTPVDLGAVIRKAEHMLHPLAQAGEVSLECSLEEGCLVYATGDDLSQVAFNLMENAVKYNLPGGRVMVNLSREGDEIVLRVEDTGVGIPEEDLDKVFNRFYRVDKARSRAAGGTGLGLSIVRDMVRQHGGTVTAGRREPEGSCFTVRFPAWKEGGEKA